MSSVEAVRDEERGADDGPGDEAAVAQVLHVDARVDLDHVLLRRPEEHVLAVVAEPGEGRGGGEGEERTDLHTRPMSQARNLSGGLL